MKVMMIVARLNIGGVALNVVQLVNHLNQMPDVEVLLVNGQVGADEGDMQYLVEKYDVQQVRVALAWARNFPPARFTHYLAIVAIDARLSP